MAADTPDHIDPHTVTIGDDSNFALVALNDELRDANRELAKTSTAWRLSSELTSAIIESMRSPLLILSADLRIVRVNRAFLEAFGVERQDTIGHLVYELGNRQWDIPELRRLLEDILPNHSEFVDFEVTHNFQHIGTRTMSLNARRLAEKNEKLRLIVLAITDISAATNAAQILKDQANELARSNAELDQFAAVASHDLQEPLRMISSYVDLLQIRYESLFDAKASAYMTHVTNGTRRLREMIEAILTYSRVGHESTDIRDIDCTDAYESAIANLKSKIETYSGRVVCGTLPRLRANRLQVSQLLQNLVSNGLKFASLPRSVGN